MPAKFNMYIGVTATELDEFERLWHLHKASLKPLPNEVHNNQDGYAAVFNTWIRYTHFGQPLIVKPCRVFIHGSVHALSSKLKMYMPYNIKQLIGERRSDIDFMFIYSYCLTYNIMKLIEEYIEDNHLSKYLLEDYYLKEDFDMPENSDVYLLIKDIMFGFVNLRLTEKTISLIYCQSIHETLQRYNKINREESRPTIY